MKHLFIIFFSCLFCVSSNGQSAYSKKLIQFGWDYPTISDLKDNLKQMEKQPFDGVAFSFQKIFELFDTTVYPQEFFQFEDLKKLQWKTFTHNFIRVRAQSSNGPRWYDDRAWANMEKNLRNISLALQVSGARGIFFDPENYVSESAIAWIYNETLYPGIAFSDVGAMVKKRGAQFMRGITYHKKDVEIFALWMLSLVYLQQQEGPLPKAGMALYPFFVEGMLEAKDPRCKIIDGNELAYYYRYASDFIQSGEQLRLWGRSFMPADLKPEYSKISISQPIFYDGIFATSPQFDKGFSESQKIDWLRENLYNAFKTSDEYVWYYNQHQHWWNSTIDPVFPRVIREVKARLSREFNNKKKKRGASSLFDFSNRKVKNTGYFSYSFNPRTGVLSITQISSNLKSLSVYSNSNILYNVNINNKTSRLTLKEWQNSNVILIATDSEDKHSIVYLN